MVIITLHSTMNAIGRIVVSSYKSNKHSFLITINKTRGMRGFHNCFIIVLLMQHMF